MEVKAQLVAKLAEDAKIGLQPGESEQLAAAMGKIAGVWDILKNDDAASFAPWSPPVNGGPLWRDDIVVPSAPVEESTGHAARHDGKMFLVPEILG